MDLTSNVINLLQLPDTVSIMAPEESWFDFTAGWLLAVICGFIMLFQVFKLFFEIGERYVVLSILVFFAPVAFAMGGSRSTEDIFKGWVRMFGSMCVVMVSNVFFLKVILSALSTIPNTLTIIPWLILSWVCAKLPDVSTISCADSASMPRIPAVSIYFPAPLQRWSCARWPIRSDRRRRHMPGRCLTSVISGATRRRLALGRHLQRFAGAAAACTSGAQQASGTARAVRAQWLLT